MGLTINIADLVHESGMRGVLAVTALVLILSVLAYLYPDE